eukprot:TRINITY_DN4234_c2_g1_i1.p1 TRINITY_DN4234_c2_g1~~TRINITY_DN4234_c2_g1_i1.p1  ORF type:complete len:168 (-),score=56.70 TRINITY_DN4234_c2_g1_i1:4-507(-)
MFKDKKKDKDKDKDKKKQQNDALLCLEIRSLQGYDLISCDSNGLSDPYIILKLNGEQTKKTKVKPETLNPVWDDVISFYAFTLDLLEFKVMDKDRVGSDDFMGTCSLDLKGLTAGQKISVTQDLAGVKKGKISFEVSWKPSREEDKQQEKFDPVKAHKMALLSRTLR